MDALSYFSAVVAIFAVVLLGAWVPMRTALRVDPARVLRTE
jgi:ABC-type antimicrobial peptide transport system permease subunit